MLRLSSFLAAAFLAALPALAADPPRFLVDDIEDGDRIAASGHFERVDAVSPGTGRPAADRP